MRVTDIRRMTLAGNSRRKLDASGAPIVGKRYWIRLDLTEKRPITLPAIPASKFMDKQKSRYQEE